MRFGKWKVWPYLMVCLCMMSQAGLAQTRPEAYSHPELEWKTITTPHFTVSYHALFFNASKKALYYR